MTSLKRYNESTECNAVNATNGIQYRYKESTSSTWGAWKNVHSTTSADGSVSTTAFVISLDNQKEWDFEFKITDKISSTTIARHVGQGQPQFFIGADGRTSVGGVPQIAIPENKLGQLEVNGNAYANGHRLAEIPITNDMLGSKCVKSDNIDFTTFGYSFAEQLVGVWIDGKPLYKKTVTNITINVGETWANHNIANIDQVVKCEVMQAASNGKYVSFPALVNTSGSNYMNVWTVTRTQLHFFSSIKFTDGIYATVWYTKTTD